MKILLVAVNAKYIHSNPAVYSLASCCRERARGGSLHWDGVEVPAPETEIAEYTINQQTSRILADIYGRKPDVLMFSCYIWNRREVVGLIRDAKSVMPDVDIWIGGPEVSFDAENILKTLPEARGIMRGEGEEIFCRLAALYSACGEKKRLPVRGELERVEGITFRDGETVVSCDEPQKCVDLDALPFPYEKSEGPENRIIYYESSRGCPFRCAYCLSSVDRTMRFRDVEKVKDELRIFIDSGVPQVKFVDRTFNCERERALDIWRFLAENDNGVTNFHFEIAGDILGDEELALLGSVRPGQFQLEIGVQSTNGRTLEEIRRNADLKRLGENVAAIKRAGNVHVHLDLIAGLPYEDYGSFSRSFDDVFAMGPDQLQLGFLKVLSGTPMEEKRDTYGIKHTAEPPYEVLKTRWISYEDIIRLKGVEEMVEVYHNSGQFGNSLALLMGHFAGPFSFFEALAGWYEDAGTAMVNVSRNARYERLLAFAADTLSGYDLEEFVTAMIFDYYMRDNVKSRPEFFGAERVEKSFSKAFYSIEAREHRYLSGGRYDTDDPRLLRKLTHLEKAGGRYYLFDYEDRDPLNGNARVIKIEERIYLERHTDLT